MRYLFDNIQTIHELLHSKKRILLLSDYDGTLAPIQKHPDLAILSEKVRELLIKFSSHKAFRLGIVTGRSLQQIKKLINIQKALYVANYGIEIEGPNICFISPEAKKARYILWNTYLQLLKSLRHIEGVYIEDKGLSISLHYRLVKTTHDMEYITKTFHTITKPFLDKEMLYLSTGKMVYEIRPPVKWNKATRITWLLANYFPPEFSTNALIIYLGDDSADKEVFTTLHGKGVTIFVGEPSNTSSADYFVHSPKEVIDFLEYLYKQKSQAPL
ncbi:MAG: Trehalose-6-phosphate phosphatase [Candidatus Jettenia ecosi]|uniref:Trehalose 6-phosphate phosphatase n=1 Tax=Candidatus Jettenia ecosi TaxID=2494326 RepID=A0A533Q923_9BACT|nr:MAG: Trehalose-6-phosphate phosphatase [Candidatus Jettenia ecosi]